LTRTVYGRGTVRENGDEARGAKGKERIDGGVEGDEEVCRGECPV